VRVRVRVRVSSHGPVPMRECQPPLEAPLDGTRGVDGTGGVDGTPAVSANLTSESSGSPRVGVRVRGQG
jgi:hypothetical protein